ncbi:ComEA family DNA-binding protein [Flavobacterium sp. W1B]|uniref:ComEA family DNA-binding protein n=1 Tax=Flavobacterium sp. W1B TaxID=3394146 RepID=UPI0039BCA563
MDFKKANTYFKFSKSQCAGIFSLFTIIIVLQLICFFVGFGSIVKDFPEKQNWLSLQREIDSMKESNSIPISKKYPFNPNFITDYKGYKLGMSVQEIDRLLAYRKEGKFVNSAKEFQNVTQVSDSLLNTMAPYFKFPDWVNRVKESYKYVDYEKNSFSKKEKLVLIDINQATKEDLMKVYGIGEVISMRILKLKESLGGFVSMEQMSDVWGLSPEVIEKLNAYFKVSALPDIKKVDINNASLKEIALFPYFKYALAKEIVIYRSMNGDLKNAEDLTKIKGFPIEKANIIGLYLDFN